jgi:hypothetical protein
MNKEKLISTLTKNLDVGHYVLMDIIVKEKDISELWSFLKIRGWREALIRKSLIEEIDSEYFLTDRGKLVYKELNGIEEKEVEIVFDDKFESLCKEIIDEVNMKILIRTSQKRLVLKSGKIFNCDVKQLQKRLRDYSVKFKNSNFDNIKRAILNYTDDILDSKISFPRTILYFIWKEVEQDGKRVIISDMETYIETLEEKEKIIDKTKLFG